MMRAIDQITETDKNHPTQGALSEGGETPRVNADGIIREIGELSPNTIVTESGLARLLNRHKVSIKRAVERDELPPPTRLLGEPVWTVGRINEHLEERLNAAKKEAEDTRKKFRALSP